jgi:plastocyanin
MRGTSAKFLSLALAVFALPLFSRAQATIEGNVTLLPPQKIESSAPKSRFANYSNTPTKTNTAMQPLAVVFLEGQFPATTNPPPAAEMAQKDQQFVPTILPVRVGTMVEFPNEDDFYHNVFSYSKLKSFDLGRYKKEEKPPAILFDKPGVVRLNCEIHQQMRGVIVVLETPYFTTTGTNGNFHLENLPAGKFVLKAWLDEKHVREQPVELRDGDKLHIDFPVK